MYIKMGSIKMKTQYLQRSQADINKISIYVYVSKTKDETEKSQANAYTYTLVCHIRRDNGVLYSTVHNAHIFSISNCWNRTGIKYTLATYILYFIFNSVCAPAITITAAAIAVTIMPFLYIHNPKLFQDRRRGRETNIISINLFPLHTCGHKMNTFFCCYC